MAQQLPQITYLFGAGASAQALPTVKQMPERIKAVRNFIEKNYIFNDDEICTLKLGLTFTKIEARDYLLAGFDRLYDLSHNHSTVDTYAKKLQLNGDGADIYELVFFLALYFNIEQKIKGTDPRYDAFLVSLLSNDPHSFPENLKFLSWNYDLQMEAAHQAIAHPTSRDVRFNIFSTERHYFKQDKFCSVKLNGSSNMIQRHGELTPLIGQILNPACQSSDLDFTMCFSYGQSKTRTQLYDSRVNIKFAWLLQNEHIQQISDTLEVTGRAKLVHVSF